MAEGYDTNRFQSTIDEGLTCCICLGVLKDPLQCEKNEHYFCSGCIKKHLENTSKTCPVCQDTLTAKTAQKAPRIIVDLVSRLKINCDHAERGCDAVLELGALNKHAQDCEFMPVACSNEGCDNVVSKRDIKKHEEESCQFKTVTCNDCGKEMSYNKYGAHSCVLRRDVDEMRNTLAAMHVVQEELRETMQQAIAAIRNLQLTSPPQNPLPPWFRR